MLTSNMDGCFRVNCVFASGFELRFSTCEDEERRMIDDGANQEASMPSSGGPSVEDFARSFART